MSFEPSEEDIVAAREQGDLKALLMLAAGLSPKVPAQRDADPVDETPCFHIRRPGAWPCGTAATGPTPQPCADCQKET
ncbi:hypothetical protein [Streptomyces wuyuanensis]|uniref:Uncharacterized protein n=1 Tax=Streptomyces wuyuanensis TaxID=1196353 RepID=A0A1G9ZAQ2_9ACTN|nr:hypothetical protein [Streptomyces wuyuanensis]SDN18542.1 hypothetical protein SAMN05444921_12161 [Streptomyces wuyuanensis]